MRTCSYMIWKSGISSYRAFTRKKERKREREKERKKEKKRERKKERKKERETAEPRYSLFRVCEITCSQTKPEWLLLSLKYSGISNLHRDKVQNCPRLPRHQHFEFHRNRNHRLLYCRCAAGKCLLDTRFLPCN